MSDQGHCLGVGNIREVLGLLKQTWMVTHRKELLVRSKIHTEQEKSNKQAENFHHFTITLVCTPLFLCYFQKTVTPLLTDNVLTALH